MENRKEEPIIVEEKPVYSGEIIQVLQRRVLIGRKEKIFEIARRAPGVRLIITRMKDEKEVLLTREYRHEQASYDFRLPGGKVFDSLADYSAFLESKQNILVKAIEAAKKEALEETGIVVQQIDFHKKSVCGATVEWDLYYFMVPEFEMSAGGTKLELGEDIESGWYTLDEAKKMCLSGQVQEERSVAILLQYFSAQGN